MTQNNKASHETSPPYICDENARSNTLQHTATHCNTLQHTAKHCNTLQHTATHCIILQHTATPCNTLFSWCTSLFSLFCLLTYFSCIHDAGFVLTYLLHTAGPQQLSPAHHDHTLNVDKDDCVVYLVATGILCGLFNRALNRRALQKTYKLKPECRGCGRIMFSVQFVWWWSLLLVQNVV